MYYKSVPVKRRLRGIGLPTPKRPILDPFGSDENRRCLVAINCRVPKLYPIGSMYGISTYIWLIFMVECR